jgi:uncharacterized membrane protein
MEKTMKRLILASAFAIAASCGAYAQTTAPKAPPAMPAAGQKLSQAECDTLWKQANPSNAATITEAQAQRFVSDVKAANPDNDGTLDRAEFSAACGKGLVRSSSAGAGSSSGSGSGESGAAAPGSKY